MTKSHTIARPHGRATVCLLRVHCSVMTVTYREWSVSLQWRHNGCDGVSNNQPHDCLLNRLFRRRSNKTSKLCGTVLRAGNSPVTGEFPAQMASNAENVPIWWRHHDSVKQKVLGAYLNSDLDSVIHRVQLTMSRVGCPYFQDCLHIGPLLFIEERGR